MSEPIHRVGGRLRASCDQCHRLKLKCIFNESGSCVRCQRQKIHCVRSNSKPIGRRNAPKKLKPTTPVQIPSPDASGSSTSDPFTPFRASSISGEDAAIQYLDGAHEPLQSPFREAPLEIHHAAFETNLQDPTEFAAIPPDWCNTPSFSYIPLAPPSDGPTPLPSDHLAASRSSNNTYCTCFAAITNAMRDSPPSSAEEDTVHYKLRLNRDSLAVVAGFLACDAPHEFPLIILAYVFVRKIAATFARALYMPCDAVFHFGTYTIEGEDRHALRRRIILIGVRKIKQMLGQLALKTQARRSSADGWVLEDCESVYRPICVFLQSFVRKEVDGIIKHIDDIES